MESLYIFYNYVRKLKYIQCKKSKHADASEGYDIEIDNRGKRILYSSSSFADIRDIRIYIKIFINWNCSDLVPGITYVT